MSQVATDGRCVEPMSQPEILTTGFLSTSPRPAHVCRRFSIPTHNFNLNLAGKVTRSGPDRAQISLLDKSVVIKVTSPARILGTRTHRAPWMPGLATMSALAQICGSFVMTLGSVDIFVIKPRRFGGAKNFQSDVDRFLRQCWHHSGARSCCGFLRCWLLTSCPSSYLTQMMGRLSICCLGRGGSGPSYG
ncbi:hypothetical protein BC834DRAFT_315533 [Gloeopeniophorella convolvens]|nr:hypothetical protein BC834DRAFT_315533 [Gloeopeniophorella convolvens]